MSANPGPHKWPPTWFTKFLARDSRAGASVFVIEAWVEKRWCPIAQSDYEASARRLFNQVSNVRPRGHPAPPTPGLGCFDQDAC